MMGKHLRRRFSLQPSFMKDDNADDKPKRDKWVIRMVWRLWVAEKRACVGARACAWLSIRNSICNHLIVRQPTFL